jgi:acyl-CoA hydrolase
LQGPKEPASAGWGVPAAALKPVPMSQSATTMSKLMTPDEANVYGNVHGGAILKYIDEAAAVAAWRHARVPKVVTVSLERMDFREPVYIGDILVIKATVRHVGRTSMLVGIRVEAESPTTGEVRHTASCYMTFVALDRNNKPIQVPPVVAETADEKAKMEKAKRVADIIKASRSEAVDKA